jgi:hypothetical protein
MTYNYARTLVRKVASYVFPDRVTFQFGDANQDHSAAEQVFNDYLLAVDATALDLELEIERSITGDAAIKITWDTERSRPRMVSVDPGSLVAVWSPDNPREPYQISQAVKLPGFAIAQTLADVPGAADALDPARLYDVIEHWTAQSWQISVSGGALSRTIANPYGWIPYCILPNNPRPRHFWGRSDLIDIEQICKAFNSEMTVLDAIMRMSGAPIAVIENVDASDNLRALPGAKWELPENSKAYLLDLLAGGGVDLHIKYLDQVRTTMHDLSETPRTAFGDSGRALSGAALQVEIQPLVQRVQRKRTGWEHFYTQRNRRLLDLMIRNGLISIDPAITTSPIWPNVLPSDTPAETLSAVQKVTAGIQSRRSAAAALGDPNPDAEMARIEQERQADSARAISEAQAKPETGTSGFSKSKDGPQKPQDAPESEKE